MILFIANVLPCFALQAAAETYLKVNNISPAEGYFVLQWQSDSTEPLLLHQSTTETSASPFVYTVPASGSLTITGLKDGDYFFRLQDVVSTANSAALPGQLKVTVQHHSLQRAMTFFSLGVVLLLILLATLIVGSRQRGMTS